MAEQPSITSILAALAAQQQRQVPTAAQQQPAFHDQNIYQQPIQSHSQAAYSSTYSLPQPTSSGSVDLSNIKPVSSGTVSIAEAIAKAKAIAAEKGVSYERPSSYGAADPRLGAVRPYRQSRSRSRSPPPIRRDAFRDNYNPYREERRGERAPHARDQYVRERSFSPVSRSRGLPGAFSPPRTVTGGSAYPNRERSPVGRNGEIDKMETISIESNLVGLIIGRQGENLRRVESETGCKVQFVSIPDDNGPWRQCNITGSRARRAEAIAEIYRIIDESGMGSGTYPPTGGNPRDAATIGRASSHQPVLRDGEDSMQIMVPDRTVGLIIGRGGETIRDLQERSGCHVNIVGEQKSVNGLRPVNLIGSREAAAKAKDLIMEIVESDSKSVASKDRAPAQREPGREATYGVGSDKISDSIFVPSDAVGMIIGKGGETIKDIQSSSGCKVNVSPSSGAGETEREIGLVGTRDAIDKAKRAIEDKVEAVQLKNGGGGRNRASQQLDYGDRSHQQAPYSMPQGQASQSQAQMPVTAVGEDQYAPYGGYQAYVALWYQALAAQQQSGQPQGDQSKPPGTT